MSAADQEATPQFTSALPNLRREAGADLLIVGACSNGGEVEGNFHLSEHRAGPRHEQSCHFCSLLKDFL